MHRYSSFTSRLEGVRTAGRGLVALCPAHDDRRPSLSLWVSEETGDLMAKCHSGCTFDEIIQAMGVEKESLLAERARKPMQEVAAYKYHDRSGNLLYEVVRFEPKDFRCRRVVGGQYEWGLGDRPRVLYRLPQVLAERERTIILTEGEKAVDFLVNLGFVATCSPGGAGKWRDDYCRDLTGRRVAILPDGDEPGINHALAVYDSLSRMNGHATCAAIIHLPDLPDKGDVVDWLNDKRHDPNELKALCKEGLRVEQILNDLENLSATDKWRAIDRLQQTFRPTSG